MKEKQKHLLRYLAEKNVRETRDGTGKELLNDFFRHEYDRAEWQKETMETRDAVSASITVRIEQERKKRVRKLAWYNYSAAAAIAFLFVLSYLLLSPGHQPVVNRLSTSSSPDSVTLSDGSIIYLAANSVFEYPDRFSGKARSVSLLRGDAFFKIAKDKAHPFIISAGKIKTQVLGTSFHIALAADRTTVAVMTGHVRVSSDKQSVDLRPLEEASFFNNRLEKRKAAEELLFAWYSADLQLNNVSLDKVLKVLNFRYGTTYNAISSDQLSTRLTIFIKRNAPINDILDQINYVTPLKLKLYDKTITAIP